MHKSQQTRDVDLVLVNVGPASQTLGQHLSSTIQHKVIIFILFCLFTVISATIEDVVHYEEHQETELLLHVHGILRQSLPLFTVTSPRRLRRSSPGIRWTADVGGPPLDQLPSPPADPGGLEPKRYGGRVIAHHKCGIRRPQEPDELFLFLGRVKLRRARLQCAPRLDDFHAVWETALKNGENPCLLD